MSVYRYLAVALLLLPVDLMAQERTANQKTINFACILHPDNPVFVSANAIYQHFFKLRGTDFSMQATSEKRMISEVSSGRMDGGCGENRHVFEILDNSQLLIGNTPIAEIAVMAVSRTKIDEIHSLEQLQDSPLRIGIIANTGTALAAQSHNVSFLNIVTIESGIKMLAGNRLDYIVSNQIQIDHALKSINSETPLHASDALFSFPAFPLFHKKHKALIPSIDAYLLKLHQCLEGPISRNNIKEWSAISGTKIDHCLENYKAVISSST